MDIHYKYAAKLVGSVLWIGENDEGNPCLVSDEKKASTRWNGYLAIRMIEHYMNHGWNPMLGGDRPTFEVVKVHRPQKIADLADLPR